MKTLKVATAFSGGFGSIEFSLKYSNIPHEIVFACEWLEPQQKSYLLNHGEPTSNFYKDIRDMDGTKYKDQIDLLHLSPPCQSYSMSGNREGASDERGGLIFEAIRLIDEVQPKMFTVENVKGLLSSNGGQDWKNILRDLHSLEGYSISWGVMNAKEQGTPQNRERVFIVGFRANCGMMPFPYKRELDTWLIDLLEEKVDPKYYLSQKMIDGFVVHKERHQERGNGFGFSPITPTDKKISRSITTRCGQGPTDTFITEANTKKGYECAEVGDSINLSMANSKTRRGRVGKQVAQTLDTACNQAVIEPFIVASRGRNSDNPSDRTVGAPTVQHLEPNHTGCSNAITTVQKDNLLFEPNLIQIGNIDQQGHNSLWGRVYDPAGIASTQNANGGGLGAKTGLYYIEGRIRRLTPRECARLFGDFKDKFQFGDFKDTKIYEFIGNAIDINTYRNLLDSMLKHAEKLEWNDPRDPSFKIQNNETKGLFDEKYRRFYKRGNNF